MSDTVTVACVIPMFNAASFIGQAIQSVLDQSYPVSEIIVVDDGSTDGCADIVSTQFGQATLLHQPNSGAPKARNRGLSTAQSEFVAFLDADDLWLPNKLELQIGHFVADARLGASLSHMENFWMEDVAEEQQTDAAQALIDPQVGTASSFIARAQAFTQVGPLNEKLKHRDIQEWLVRAEGLGWKTVNIPDVLVKRRIHQHNMSRNRINPDSLEFLEIARAALAGRRRRDRH